MSVLPIAAAVSALALGGVYLALAVRLPLGTVEQPGPGFFPLVISLVILATGLGSAAEVIRRRRPHAPVPRLARRRVAAAAAALFGFCLALPIAGYVASVFVLLLVILRLFGLDRWLAAGGLALVLTAASWYGFGTVLGVPLPGGPWGP